MPEYLYIRILEACNADCFMCDFAKSKDRYRFGVEQFKQMLPRLFDQGIRYVRFTGGEPLLHRQVIDFVQMITDQRMQSSIITNGTTLARKAPLLAKAGLGQIIVSLDGLENTHDRLRGTPGLFSQGIEGLQAAKRFGIALRVNSVVGPDNFKDMMALQSLLSDIPVAQWELSSLKLERKLDYLPGDRELVEREIIPQIYSANGDQRKLIPSGKVWCGDTAQERDLYFETGSTPRADGVCHIVDHVRYFDAKNGRLYACPLIPHRIESETLYPAFAKAAHEFSVEAPDMQAQAAFFRGIGPQRCTGCSSTASGLSNEIGRGAKLQGWAL